MPEPEPEPEPEVEGLPSKRALAAQAKAAHAEAKAARSEVNAAAAASESIGSVHSELLKVSERVRSVLAGHTPVPDKSICPVVHTPEHLAKNIAALARVSAEDTVLDLGCGDGRVVCNVAQACGCRGFGVDIRDECVESALARAAALPEPARSRVSFSLGDFCAMRADAAAPQPPGGLGGVTVIFTYLLPRPMERLDALLRSAVLQLGVRLVTFMAHPTGKEWSGPEFDRRKDLLGELRLWERAGEEPPDNPRWQTDAPGRRFL